MRAVSSRARRHCQTYHYGLRTAGAPIQEALRFPLSQLDRMAALGWGNEGEQRNTQELQLKCFPPSPWAGDSKANDSL